MDICFDKNIINLRACRQNVFITEFRNKTIFSLKYRSEKHYLIAAKVKVKAYVDNENCCLGEVNYQKCIDGCEHKLKKLKDKHHKHYSKDVVLTGTHYEVKNTHDVRRRRRLLTKRGGRMC